MDTVEHMRQVQALFEAAIVLDPHEREAFLDEACTGNPALRGAVEVLLTALDRADTNQLLPPLQLPTPGPSPIGERLGPYTILREIAEGGMGAVYLAERKDVGLRVALKLVRHGRLAAPQHVQRFLLERRVLARLQHPNIARLLDAGVTRDGSPYLVMEYIEGEPITRYCDHRRLAIEDRLRLFQQVCGAVEYAHGKRIIHRDLKPGNILVDEAGEVKLLDFGIAKLLAESSEVEADVLTGMGVQLVTPAYASPEQLRGEPVTPASDVYSLGVVLYELLTGHHPYRVSGCTPLQIERVVCTADPQPLSTAVLRIDEVRRADDVVEWITPEQVSEARGTDPERLRQRLRGELEAVVARTLRKRGPERYPSPAALSEDLERHLKGLPVRVRPVHPLDRARKWVAQRSTVAKSVAVAVLVLSAVIAPRWDVTRAVQRVSDALFMVEAAEMEQVNVAGADVTAADLVAVNGWIDCRGVTAGPLVTQGTVRVRRTAQEELLVTITLAGGDPGHTYSIEIFEQAESCAGSNTANTGSTLITDATGSGVAEVFLLLPYAPPGDDVIGDGEGSETLVVVLDRTLSTANGDWFVGTVPLPPIQHGLGESEQEERRAAAYLALRQGIADRAEHLLRAIVTDQPDDDEAWLKLGESQFRYNPYRGRSVVEARPAFERVLVLSADHHRAMVYLTKIASVEGNRPEVAARAERILRVGTYRDVEQRVRALLASASRDRAEHERLLAELRAAHDYVVFTILTSVAVHGRDLPTAERLARLLAEPSHMPSVRARAHLALAELALAQGRWRAAKTELMHAAELAPLTALELRALYSLVPLLAVPAAELRELRTSLAKETTPTPTDSAFLARAVPSATHQSVRLYLLGLLTPSAAQEHAASLEQLSGTPREQAFARNLAHGVRAHAKWKAGRAAAALTTLENMSPPSFPIEAVPSHFGSHAFERFLRAELLREQKRFDEALGWYASVAEVTVADLVFLAPSHHRQAEIYEHLGNRQQAVEHYSRFIELWKNCDPALRPVREEAERRLVKLRATTA